MYGRGGAIIPALKAAVPVSVPVMAGYLFLGAGYGVLMHNAGYGIFWTALLSVMVFGGTIQYIAAGMLGAGFQPLYAFAVSALVNARHLFYGFSMLHRYAGAGWKKYFLVFWLTDETFSLLCNDGPPEGVDANWFRFFVSGLDYLYWIAGGILGNAAVGVVSFDARGVDFVMTSLFTVIVVDQWRATRDHYPALSGLVLSAFCLAVFGPDYFLPPSMLLIVPALMGRRNEPDAGNGPAGERECA